MKAIILNFRGSYKTQKASNQVIVKPQGVKDKSGAEKLVNKNVKWVSVKGKEIKGKISSVHGSKGNVRAVFEKGIPGQALGKEVLIE